MTGTSHALPFQQFLKFSDSRSPNNFFQTALIATVSLFWSLTFSAQDSSRIKAQLEGPLFEFPQNLPKTYAYPSLNQARDLSFSIYNLAFWGLHSGVTRLVLGKNKQPDRKHQLLNGFANYAVQLAFCRYGSELPITLGVWAHEEYHRSILKTAGIYSHNGNWLFNRWDGTVYGPSDKQLSDLKKTNPDVLLYSYVAGVQSEIALNEKMTQAAFTNKQAYNKAALLLYNSWYVYNYFRFSNSALSDSVKRIAPQFENKNPTQRDFAGADLTAWVYDLYSRDSAYTQRSSFANGEGVNRRIGQNDLTEEGKSFLHKQQKLSLLNFLHPGILGFSTIPLLRNFSFLPYLTYYPTHFGNRISAHLLLKIKSQGFGIALQKYNGAVGSSYGVELSAFTIKHTDHLSTSIQAAIWKQPQHYFSKSSDLGGALACKLHYRISSAFQTSATVEYKTKGWYLNNPYLNSNFSLGVGLQYVVRENKI
jgi:hypothetical protein